jgi:transposase
MGGVENETQRIADLEKEIAKRNRWIDQRDRRIDKLEQEIERLRRENEKLQQAAKRQAAPFSKGPPKRNPKRRGRKAGKRYGRRASRPVPCRVDRVVEVPAPLFCPDCHKPTKLDHHEIQWQTDIPPIEPVTTEFRIDVARCVECGRTVRNRHPEQISDATGAAGVQLGPRLIALATTLNKECGVSYERIARLLKAMFGLDVNRSSLNRAVMRLAGIVQPLSEKIGRRVRDAPMLSPDETGWRVGGESAWLHVAATLEDSYYMITRGRGTREAIALIGIDYSGKIVRDGHPSYRVFSKAKSQTCLAHLLRRIEGLLQLYDGVPRTERWLRRFKRLLKRSISVSHRRDNAEIGPHGLMVAIGKAEADVNRLLGTVPRTEQVQRFARHIRRERSALFTFLHHDATPPTNHLAEQALRPAVVNRKMSAGNNTHRGAKAQATLMTVLHSARKRSADTIALVVSALRNPASVQQLL